MYGFKDNLTTEQAARIESAIDSLKPEAIEIMASEPKIQTTQNAYGWYMSVVNICGTDQLSRTIWLNALLRAGANLAGMRSAIRVTS